MRLCRRVGGAGRRGSQRSDGERAGKPLGEPARQPVNWLTGADNQSNHLHCESSYLRMLLLPYWLTELPCYCCRYVMMFQLLLDAKMG